VHTAPRTGARARTPYVTGVTQREESAHGTRPCGPSAPKSCLREGVRGVAGQTGM
jgi:hypothetical protein